MISVNFLNLTLQRSLTLKEEVEREVDEEDQEVVARGTLEQQNFRKEKEV